MEQRFKTVEIPTDLYRKIEEKIKDTETASVSDYITQILEKSLSEDQKAEPTLSKEDEEKVKERLKALGYMD